MSDDAQRQLTERRLRQFERTMHSTAVTMSETDPAATAASAVNLASHAALAVAFDPGLLHLLRINFFFDRERLPYWVEARLLLSTLCRDAEGHGLYVIDAALRDLLLKRLAVTYGPERLREIATLLWQYTERHGAWLDRSELRHAQQLTALNFLAPERAAAWLEVAEHGSGGQALPKAWFVAMRSGLPALPPMPAHGNPAAVGKALLDLDFVAQRVAHSDALESGTARIFMLDGPSDHAPRWVLLQLLAHVQPPPVLLELACPADGARSLRDLVATAAGLPPDAEWQAVRERLGVLGGARRIALAVHDAQRLGATQGAELMELLDSDLPLSMYLVGQPVDTGAISSAADLLPRLAPLGEESLRAWIDRHGGEAKLEGVQPGDPDASLRLAQQIVADTGGVPQRVLEHLCMRCGVRWPEVLDLALEPFAMAPRAQETTVAELAHEYESRRAEMVPGTARTRVMEEIVARMRAVLAERQDWPLRQWTESTVPGMRLAAVAWLQLQPQASFCDWLGARIPHETPFVVYHALLALMNAATRLPPDELDPVARAVRVAASQLPTRDNQTDRAALLRRTETILSQRRAGTSSSLPLLPIRNEVVLPGRKMQLLFDRPEALDTLSRVQGTSASLVFAVLDASEGSGFNPLRLRRVGTIARVSEFKTIDAFTQVTLEGQDRTLGKAVAAPDGGGPMLAELTPLPDIANPDEPAGTRTELADALRALARIGLVDATAPERAYEGSVADMSYWMADELELAATGKQSLLEADDPQAMLRQLVAAAIARIEHGLPESMGADGEGLSQLAATLDEVFVDKQARAALAGAAHVEPGGGGAMSAWVVGAASNGRLRAVVARALAMRPGDEGLWEQVEALSAPREVDANPDPRPRDRREALKLWPNGSTLRIRFLGGDEKLHRRVMKVASAWFEHANLHYEVLPRSSTAAADLRIAFDPQDGSWSYLGMDARNIAQGQPTMNLGWARGETDNAAFSRVVLKQFGHALGLLQEHQNPNGGIAWNRAAVMVGMAQPPNFWSNEQIQQNMLQPFEQVDPPYRPFDPHSVMLHSFPAEYVQSHQAIDGGSTLSASDKRFIAELYPREPGAGARHA